MLRFLPETDADREAVESLLDLAFAPGRGALSSYQLRQGVAPVAALCRIVRDEWDAVVAAIRYWPVAIGPEDVRGDVERAAPVDAEGVPALLLGPIAVHPTRQGEGVGARLMGETLEDARALGWERVILVGDEPYYTRFGFSRAVVASIEFPKPVNPSRVLGLALRPDAFSGLSGTVRRVERPASAEEPAKAPRDSKFFLL